MLALTPKPTGAFEQLCGIIDAENPMAAQLLEMLWEEAIMARRSALFWQQMSDVEKDMANRMMENMTQMRQNYLPADAGNVGFGNGEWVIANW